VYFAGDALNAFSDWFSGGRSIQSGVPYVNKSDAITASLGRAMERPRQSPTHITDMYLSLSKNFWFGPRRTSSGHRIKSSINKITKHLFQ
jgi:hypothetical protein